MTLAAETDLAKERTELAEDRTLLANERTFAGWVRTTLSSVGVGLGIHALFDRIQPWWIPRSAASVFLVFGLAMIVAADRRACAVYKRFSTGGADQMGARYFHVVTGLLGVLTAALIGGVWLLPHP